MNKFYSFIFRVNGIHKSGFPFLRFCILFLLLVLLVGCGSNTKVDRNEYVIRIIDIDDDVIGEKNIDVEKYDNVFDAIKSEFNTDGEIGDYGAYITSINNSVIDPNWSLICFVNDKESNLSCDKIVPKKDDIIEFRNICWASIDYGYGATMDEYDVLVDKALYHYLKTVMKDKLEDLKTYKEGSYWEMLILDLCKMANIDKNLLNYNFTDELISELNNVNLNDLSGADIGKYYIHAKACNNVSEEFNNFFNLKLNEINEWNDYVTPFMIFPASHLKISNEKIIELANNEINGNIEWGPTGNLWKLICQSLFVDRSDAINLKDYIIKWEEAYEFGSNCDNSLVLMAASSLGIDIRDTNKYGTILYENVEYDYLAYIMTRYYDKSTNLVKVYDEDIQVGMSSNQVYAGLLSYKIFKNTGKPANIFGPLNYN